MDLGNTGLFKLMKGKLDWLTERQQVLAQNIANADTPKYRPNDLTAFTFDRALGQSQRLAPRLTAVGHMAGPGSARGNDVRQDKPKSNYEVAPDGNAVVMEEQMTKIADTGMTYQLVTNLYRKQVGLVRTVIGRGAS
ncbi:flagellar basal-body rod protein FlgB [Skermanella stibiiresistens SB22]|uniref:Flagellar basal body rod protein FlgB n=1 Tax=Skermanella stibiiresistens SB22 TaxID=1385369 RepID=W9GTE8_9PROT|nr:flagellar basal body rod protein FlgB [Skermanella stibiiresistens]EWY37145.1 flagellar basal-body rod protein FlgB [Skermanella stibiiresistens SB22]